MKRKFANRALSSLLLIAVFSTCFTTTTHAKSCDGNQVTNSPSNQVPGSIRKFRSALSNVARIQYPTSSPTCLSSNEVREKKINDRWFIYNNNMRFDVPKNKQRLELRGNTFNTTRGADRVLRFKFKTRNLNKSGHSQRFTVGQLFAENYSEDAAKLTITDGKLEINYNDGKSRKTLGDAPVSTFEEVTLTLKRRISSTTYNALSVTYRGRTTQIRLSKKYYNASSDKAYFKAGCYIHDRTGKCLVEP